MEQFVEQLRGELPRKYQLTGTPLHLEAGFLR
jgi:hypothetical protein